MTKRINWTMGLTRIYLLLVFIWVLYLIFWIPMKQAEDWRQLSIYTQDESKRSEYLSHANLIAQWKELWKESAKTPIFSLAVLIFPPVLGYSFLRLIIFTTKWVFAGFRHND